MAGTVATKLATSSLRAVAYVDGRRPDRIMVTDLYNSCVYAVKTYKCA